MEAQDTELLYEDSTTRIYGNRLKLNGLLLPYISVIEMGFDEIEGISIVDLPFYRRWNLLGSQDLKSWWTFDPIRPRKKYGFIVRFLHTRYKLGFTVADFEKAHAVLAQALGERLKDERKS